MTQNQYVTAYNMLSLNEASPNANDLQLALRQLYEDHYELSLAISRLRADIELAIVDLLQFRDVSARERLERAILTDRRGAE